MDRVNQVNEDITADPAILGQNTLKNLHYIIPDVIAVGSQIYYVDVATTLANIGDIIYRVLFSGLSN